MFTLLGVSIVLYSGGNFEKLCLCAYCLNIYVLDDGGNEEDMPPLEEGADEDSSKMEEVD